LTDLDSPWKEVLDQFFPLSVAFLFSDIYQDIDWQRRYEALDQELQQIMHDAEVGKRLADKLFKVWLKNGEEAWVLVHIELQSWITWTEKQRWRAILIPLPWSSWLT
jgi:hypothetical protein